ncbi:MAG: SDR family oxidoreductase [Pseudomonadota bacterium]
MEVTMAGRAALITGGSLGIGRAIAKRFSAAGADIALVARRSDVLDDAVHDVSATARGNVIAISADVATAEGCQHAFDETIQKLGKVDVLVNNAGQSTTGKIEALTDDVWRADIDLKLMAAVRLARAALPEMAKRKWGRIINVLNTAAKAPDAGRAPTAVTRAAGLALTKVLAGEGAPNNVLVNALLVGRIESDQWVRRHNAEGRNRSLADFYAEMGQSIPLGRVGTAEEFANVACFLASEQGSYVTGTAINVDGGMCPVT